MRIKNSLYKKTRAFTLTEILVVITLIFIISGIVIVSVQDARKLARDKRRMSDFAGYQVALQEYYAKHKYYPYFELTGDENQKKTTCENYGRNEQGKCTFDTDSSFCCQYNDGICACLAPSILKPLQDEGLLEKLPLDPLNKTEETREYKYKYVFLERGVDYKMFVPLEKDTQAMQNDGGSDASWYEIFSTMGSSIAIKYFKYFGIGGGLLSCNLCDVSGENKCGGSDIPKCDTETKKIVIKISSPSNAHAEEPSGSNNYNCAVECSGPPGFNVTSQPGNQDCIGITFLTLSANTNAHVGKNYTNSDNNRKICFDYSGASCRIVDTKAFLNKDCKQGETCILRIFSEDNAHIIADCNDNTYPYKVCCK